MRRLTLLNFKIFINCCLVFGAIILLQLMLDQHDIPIISLLYFICALCVTKYAAGICI